MKGFGTVRIREIYNTGFKGGVVTATDRAVAGVKALTDADRYWPGVASPGRGVET